MTQVIVNSHLSNIHNVPLPLAVWLAVDEYDYALHSNEISATTLLRSPRYIVGSRREMFPLDFPEELRPIQMNTDTNDLTFSTDIQDRLKARMGHAVHSSVENAWKNYYRQGLTRLGHPTHLTDNIRINPVNPNLNHINVFLEQRKSSKPININGREFIITGQFDMVLDGELHDVKTTSTFVYQNNVMDFKYILQGSIYRWLNPDLITKNTITINFIFTDWKKQFKNDDSYPPAAVFSKTYQLLSLEETEAYIRNKLSIVVDNWNNPLNIIPCCPDTELYSRPSIFKWYKDGYAEGKRSTKNFSSFAEASFHRATKGNYLGDIVEVKPDPFMCPFCNPEEVKAGSIIIHSPQAFEIG